jgi:hypothetical protein
MRGNFTRDISLKDISDEDLAKSLDNNEIMLTSSLAGRCAEILRRMIKGSWSLSERSGIEKNSMEWISVKDKQPKEGEYVLGISKEWERPAVLYYDRFIYEKPYYWTNNTFGNDNVRPSHWMPLPNPPKD